MGNADLTTAVVVGAIVGLLSVALGHAQMVWFARRRRAHDSSSGKSSSQQTLLFGSAASVASLCLIHAATTRTLPGRRGFLVGENLFSVRPRPGLIAKYETSGATVHRGDSLIRFTGPDGEEALLAIKNRRQLLDAQLEAERTRPLDFDAETVRRADVAQATLREREQRVKQLTSERDAIVREVMQQKLAVTNRQFRLEQDDRAAQRELEPLQASLLTEKDALRSMEELLKRGWVSRMEAARGRDAVSKLEGRIRELEDARSIFTREQREVATLRALTQKTLERQLSDRTASIADETAEIVTARKMLDQATAALEQDRPRAMTQRQKRLRDLESEIQDCDALLNGGGPRSIIEAPWDGRIGFREPSPASVPADNGPLLVLYRPGTIGTMVSLEPDEARMSVAALHAEIEVTSALPGAFEGIGRTETLLPGAIAPRQRLPDGSAEIGISCDPPDRVVRQLAMGGSVPVVVRMSRGITSATSFWLGVGFGALSLGVALSNALRRRPRGGRRAEEPGFGPFGHGDGGTGPIAPRWPGATRPNPTGRVVAALPPAAALVDVSSVLAEHGPAAAVLVGAGLGPTVDPEAIERVALGLLATAPPETLGDATRDCAELLRVMRAIGSEYAAGVLERLRLALIMAALDAAQRQGASSETAAMLVKALVEA